MVAHRRLLLLVFIALVVGVAFTTLGILMGRKAQEASREERRRQRTGPSSDVTRPAVRPQAFA